MVLGDAVLNGFMLLVTGLLRSFRVPRRALGSCQGRSTRRLLNWLDRALASLLLGDYLPASPRMCSVGPVLRCVC